MVTLNLSFVLLNVVLSFKTKKLFSVFISMLTHKWAGLSFFSDYIFICVIKYDLGWLSSSHCCHTVRRSWCVGLSSFCVEFAWTYCDFVGLH